MNLGQYKTKQQVIASVKTIKQEGNGKPKMSLAIKTMRETMFPKHGRKGATKVFKLTCPSQMLNFYFYTLLTFSNF